MAQWDNKDRPSVAKELVLEGGLMLATRHRLLRNPYFRFHPLHTAFSFLGALILFGMLIWFLVVPAH